MMVRININVADIRKEPQDNSERITQGLFNEIAEVMTDSDSWSRIKFLDGYEGWIRKAFISTYCKPYGEDSFVVALNLSPGYIQPNILSRVNGYFPYGCLVEGIDNGQFLEIKTERYGICFLNKTDLIEKSSLVTPPQKDEGRIVLEAEKFLGVPYLWGGRSFFGIDCSGFSQAIMKRFGIKLPRDSKDQIHEGSEINRKDIRTGDLLFFPRHVAISTSGDMLIHSSSSNGGVAYNSLDPKSPMYSENLDKTFITARRFF